jgi:transmembrane sensor
MTPLERLGRAVASDLDEAGRRLDAIALARSRLTAPKVPARDDGRKRFIVAGVLALAVLTAMTALFVRRASPLAFTVGDGREVVPWLSATADPVPVVFSDGTRIVLAPFSSARVLSTDAHGAELVLEAGRTTATVKHRPGTAWRLHAGPYEVKVTGTKFELAWDPALQEMSLVMDEGQVVVSGCGLAVRTVSAGQTLNVTCGSVLDAGGPSSDEAEPSAQPVLPAATLTPTPPKGPAVARVEPPIVHRLSPQAVEATSWQRLAAAGRYGDAFLAAQRGGLDATTEKASAQELLMLADTERLSGHSDEAEVTLQTLRRRYGGTAAAGVAAFHLGRLAFDRRGAYSIAGSYFALYLKEQPAGPFAREAAGRLIEARQRSGDSQGARAAAESYVTSFPDGPHAALAKSLIQP